MVLKRIGCVVGVAVLLAAKGGVRGQTDSAATRPGQIILPIEAAAPTVDLMYTFGEKAGYTAVGVGDAYSIEKGYGFDLGSRVTVKEGAATAIDGKGFFFSSKLAPGAYRVTVMLGGTDVSETTVKSESRRLMVEGQKVGAGETVARSFLVHIRVPTIPGAEGAAAMVALKPREKSPILMVHWDNMEDVPFLELDWDEKLTLEFSGSTAAVRGMEIVNAEKPLTIYLVGDSTMTDQPMGPWTAWGQMLPRWFKEPVLIANYAESGETAVSFIGEKRWPKLLSEVHAGDYVLMQFGINDRNTPLPRFKQTFERLVKEARDHGAIPVLVTSQNLRKLDADGKGVNTLGGYPQTMRDVAKEQGTVLIDLNAMSMKFYEAIGPEKLPKVFVDSTHHSPYGAYELAKCVVSGMVEDKLPFTTYLSEDWKGFDPSKPDVMEDFKMPADPQLDPARPGGPGGKNGVGPMAGVSGPPRATSRGTTQVGTTQPVGK